MKDRFGVLLQLLVLVVRERNWWLLPIAVGVLLAALLVTVSALLPLSPLLYPLI